MEQGVRRIVTGHDRDGNAIFAIDDLVQRGKMGFQVWSCGESPVSNRDETDGGKRELEITSPGGNLLRVGSIPPGHSSYLHRTQTIDYGIIIDGELELELDDGVTKTVRSGDVVVQRGTMHAWHNRTEKPCKAAFVLIAAEPLVVGGKLLEPTHS